jgi:ribosomal protein L11 methyltransferase
MIEAQDSDAMNAAEQLLYNAGFKGIALNDISVPPRITGYLPEDDRLPAQLRAVDAALALLPAIGIDGISDKAEVSFVEEEDWANAWKKYFKPIRVGKRLIVTPPWESPALADDDLPIVIDPGMAFGTGSHGTTQLCLEALEQSVAPGATVADIGTGSGILAIAAAKLGAGDVYAMDIDPLAVRIATENADVNGTALTVTEEMPEGRTFDVVVANILADTLISLRESLTALTAPGGTFIASGIISHRADDVRAAFENCGFGPVDQRTQGEWVAQVYRRTAS